MSINEKLRSQQNDELFTAILTLENTEECYAFSKIFVRLMN